jgi:hypothetical protein
MIVSNERLAFRFVELLAEKAMRNGQTAPRWITLPLEWRRVWTETIPAFLQEIGCRVIPDDGMEERDEDDQIRLFCDNLTARQRLKTYRQLYALGCRIDGIERAIDTLAKRS